MTSIKVISFDAEGTLVTPQFSQVIWHESIPALFAQRWGMQLERARREVTAAYDEVGEQRMEWYDIKYWFKRFDLGNHESLLESYRHKITYYDDVPKMLPQLARNYKLIVVSNSSREFLNHLMAPIEDHFQNIFSALSDFRTLKSPELYRGICDLMKIEPSEMIHVGDSWEFDYSMPLKAGVRGVFLDREGSCGGEGTICDLHELNCKL